MLGTGLVYFYEYKMNEILIWHVQILHGSQRLHGKKKVPPEETEYESTNMGCLGKGREDRSENLFQTSFMRGKIVFSHVN